MKTIGLDVGARRTGVAFLDSATGITLPLDTLRHVHEAELVSNVARLAKERGVDRVVVGLPLLPSGEEGEQARFVRAIALRLEKEGLAVSLLDERYSTDRPSGYDKDAAAACHLLSLFAEREAK